MPEEHASQANNDANAVPVSNSRVVSALSSPKSDSSPSDESPDSSSSSSELGSPPLSVQASIDAPSSPSQIRGEHTYQANNDANGVAVYNTIVVAALSSPKSDSSSSDSSSSPSDESPDSSSSSSDSGLLPLAFQAAIDVQTSSGSWIREEHVSRANNDANAVSKPIVAALLSPESDSSSPHGSTPPFKLPYFVKHPESSSSSTESNPSPPSSQAPIDAAPNSSRSQIRESSPSDNVRVKRPRPDVSTASIHAPDGNRSLDVAQSSIEAPMSPAMDVPDPSRDGSSACFGIPMPPDESSPEPERTNTSRVIRQKASIDSRPSWRRLIETSGVTAGRNVRSRSTSIQPSRGGTMKIKRKGPDLLRHARVTLEALLKELAYTKEPPGRLPVCIRPPAEQPKSDGEPSRSICIGVGDPQEMNGFLRAIDTPKTEIPVSVPEATTEENCSNCREGSCLAEAHVGIGSQNSPERNPGPTQPERNDPESSGGVPGSSSDIKISDSIPYLYQVGNELNRGLPSMDLSVEGIERALESVGTHISFFATVLINEHMDLLNHTRGNFEFFRLAYETFKENEYVKVMKLLDVARSILKLNEAPDDGDLNTKLSDSKQFLSQLNYAYFLILMHNQYRPKIKETRVRIQALENTVRSIKEWKKSRLFTIPGTQN